MSDKTAVEVSRQLEKRKSAANAEVFKRFFKTGPGEYGEGDIFIGVRTSEIGELSKSFLGMEVEELEKLLHSSIHEYRAAALSIMNREGRLKKTSGARRKELFDFYLKNTKHINNWDLVDGSAAFVVGAYLQDKPRDILYKLAKSKLLWERRIAMVATWYFIRQGQLDDAFKVAEVLLHDKEDLIHKAVGWMLRSAGDKDRARLVKFLDKYAATMPRTLLRYSLEKFDEEKRLHYMRLKDAK